MKIGLAQINPRVGDLEGNCSLILGAYRDLRSRGADLVVCPELALCGYPPRDLLERSEFLDLCQASLLELTKDICDGGALLLGAPTAADGSEGRAIHNSALLIKDARIQSAVHKTLLPTYDVFDEGRYFEPAATASVKLLSIAGKNVGVTICEDVWNDSEFWPTPRYRFDPAQHLIRQGAELLINLSASPFHIGKPRLRRQMLQALATTGGLPVVHCNLVGGNDELIFDGDSFVAWPDGDLQSLGPSFDTGSTVLDLEGTRRNDARIENLTDDTEAAIEALTLGIRDYFSKCGFQDAVVGLSGGIDSALCAALAVRALGAEHVVGITMPSRYSSKGSVEDSKALAKNLGIPIHCVPIEPIHQSLRGVLGGLWSQAEVGGETAASITEQNLQARARGIILMAWSNRTGALVLSTGNKSELAVGYCTLYGDMAGGLAVLSDLPKEAVYRLCHRLNEAGPCIPTNILEKPPSAELAPDQKDTDSLPPYPVLDEILGAYLEEGLGRTDIVDRTGQDPAVIDHVLSLVDRAEYKRRQAAPGLRVTSKAFGQGRRIPVAAKIPHS